MCRRYQVPPAYPFLRCQLTTITDREKQSIKLGDHTHYSSFQVLNCNRRFVVVMAVGSLVGAFIGGNLLGLIPSFVLLPLLAAILLISAAKVWRHGN